VSTALDWLLWLPVVVFVLALAVEGSRPRRGAGRLALGRFCTNGLLHAAGTGLAWLTPWAAGLAAAGAPLRSPMAGLDAPAWLAVPLGVALLDALHYGAHRAFHRPWPWRLHAVHHSDGVLDASTAVRHHPLEALALSVVVAGVVWMLAIPAAAVTTYAIVGLCWTVATHADIAWPGDRPGTRLARWVVTPRLHAVHHSIDAAEADANYGTVLAVWDRMFGTWRDAPEPARVGLPAPEPAARLAAAGPIALLLSPLRPTR
jgi:sterol desaturase/sphingolipid hydroxylase (fatty acid hydroxylase superfamily)